MSDPRWTVITGASSGIGAEMARIAAARGRSLVLVARRADRLEALRSELARGQVRVETIVIDLERPEGAGELLAGLERLGIAPDTLVNNAGFGLRGGFATMPYEDQIAMVELNVVTLTRLCRLVLPGLVARRRGGIVNVSSMAAFQAIPFMGVYAATKAYVLSLSEAMHEEVRDRGVVVTAVCPGPTATEFTIRANLEKSKIFTSGAMSAGTVARLGWDAYEAGRAVAVTGAANHALKAVSHLVPRGLVRRAAAWMQG